MAAINEIVSKEAIELLLKATKEVNNLDQVLLKFIADQEKMKQSFENVSKSNDDAAKKTAQYVDMTNKATKAKSDLSAVDKELLRQQKAIETTEAKINTLQSDSNKNLIQRKKNLADANKALKDQSILNDQNAGTLEKLAAKNRLLELEKRKLDTTNKAGIARLKEINKEQDKNNAEIEKSSNKLQKQKINVGNYGSAFNGLLNPIKTAGNALKAFLANPVVAIIAGIVLAIKGLISIFKSTDSGATEMAARMEQLRAVMEVLRQTAANLTKYIAAIFKGKEERKKAAEEFNTSMKESGDRMKEAAEAAYQYAYQLDALNDAESAYISTAAENRRKIAELEYTAQDRSVSTDERKKALEEAIAIGQEELHKQKEFADQRYNIEAEKIAKSYGLTLQQVKDFIALNDEQTKAAIESDDQLRIFRDNLNDEKIKGLEELYAKSIDLDTQYFNANKRNISRLSGFEEEIRNDRIAKEKAFSDAKKSIVIKDELIVKDELLDLEEDFTEEVSAEDEKRLNINEDSIKQAIALGNIQYQQNLLMLKANSKNEEEFARKKFELDKSMVLDSISNLEWSLQTAEISTEKRIELETELAEKKLELNQMVAEDDELKAQQQRERLQSIQDDTIGIINSLFQFRSDMLNNEQAELDQQKEAGILSEEEYAKKSAEIELKAAKAARAKALFDIAINTAIAVSKVWGQTGVAGILAQVAPIAMGALQAAAVLSAPLPTIPAFAEGTHGKFNTPLTFVAGEAGQELITQRSGKTFKTTGATLFSGNEWKGARITSNPELEKMQSISGHTGFNNSSNTQLISEVRELNKTMKNKPTWLIDEKSKQIVGVQQNNSVKRIINRYRYEA